MKAQASQILAAVATWPRASLDALLNSPQDDDPIDGATDVLTRGADLAADVAKTFRNQPASGINSLQVDVSAIAEWAFAIGAAYGVRLVNAAVPPVGPDGRTLPAVISMTLPAKMTPESLRREIAEGRQTIELLRLAIAGAQQTAADSHAPPDLTVLYRQALQGQDAYERLADLFRVGLIRGGR